VEAGSLSGGFTLKELLQDPFLLSMESSMLADDGGIVGAICWESLTFVFMIAVQIEFGWGILPSFPRLGSDTVQHLEAGYLLGTLD